MSTPAYTRTGMRVHKYAMHQDNITVEVLPSCTAGWLHTDKGLTSFTVLPTGQLSYDNPEVVDTQHTHALRKRCLGAYKYYRHTDTQLLRRIHTIHSHAQEEAYV